MAAPANLSWDQLLEIAYDTFKILARNRLRVSPTIASDAWYDLVEETAERATPRRDVVMLEVLRSFPTLAGRPMVDESRSLSEAAFWLLREGVKDALLARLNSLRSEVMGGRRRAEPLDPGTAVRALLAVAPTWDLYASKLDELFAEQLLAEVDEENLDTFAQDHDQAGAFVRRFIREVIPEELHDVVAIIASSPELAVRPPARAESFEGCATGTLEKAIWDRLLQLVSQIAEHKSQRVA